MAHYAFINAENVVVEVIVGRDEGDLGFSSEQWEGHYASLRPGLTCKRTSYNTHGNAHLSGGTPFRGNYAGEGSIYLPDEDVFVSPQPYPDWVLNSSTYLWEPPA